MLIRYFGLTKIPMILFARPHVHTLDSHQCDIGIPLRRRTMNHLKSMYIGVLILGADLAAGLLAMDMISKSDRKLSLVFKDVQADFLKRVDGHARFICNDGPKIAELIQKVIETGERQDETLTILVTVPGTYGDEVLANISLTLSLKEKDQA
jgi:hypothetical protein